jgi:hypothetical protein
VLPPHDPENEEGEDIGVVGVVLSRQEAPQPVEGLGLGDAISGLEFCRLWRGISMTRSVMAMAKTASAKKPTRSAVCPAVIGPPAELSVMACYLISRCRSQHSSTMPAAIYDKVVPGPLPSS